MLKAIKSETPINSMYSLIPTDKRNAFKRFASCFGFTEERIKKILSEEKNNNRTEAFFDLLELPLKIIRDMICKYVDLSLNLHHEEGDSYTKRG